MNAVALVEVARCTAGEEQASLRYCILAVAVVVVLVVAAAGLLRRACDCIRNETRRVVVIRM